MGGGYSSGTGGKDIWAADDGRLLEVCTTTLYYHKSRSVGARVYVSDKAGDY